MRVKLAFWAAFAAFVVGALAFGWHDRMLSLDGPLGNGKPVVWAAFLGFLAYTAYCSSEENLFDSIRRITHLHWGRQIGIDLYLGLSLMLFVVYLNDGSLLAVALWIVPTLLFANLATLLYVAIHYEAIVSRFVSAP